MSNAVMIILLSDYFRSMWSSQHLLNLPYISLFCTYMYCICKGCESQRRSTNASDNQPVLHFLADTYFANNGTSSWRHIFCKQRAGPGVALRVSLQTTSIWNAALDWNEWTEYCTCRHSLQWILGCIKLAFLQVSCLHHGVIRILYRTTFYNRHLHVVFLVFTE